MNWRYKTGLWCLTPLSILFHYIVEETGVPWKIHRPAASHYKLYHIMLFRVHLFLREFQIIIVFNLLYKQLLVVTWSTLTKIKDSMDLLVIFFINLFHYVYLWNLKKSDICLGIESNYPRKWHTRILINYWLVNFQR
jgi:hypothetical protein